MPSHDFDLASDWCRRCGVARSVVMDQGAVCAEGETVTGISHRIAHRRMGELLGVSLTAGDTLRIPEKDPA